MPLVKAKCTNCGGTLQVDSEKKAAICPYCKEAYVVEEAINNYVTYNNTYNTTNVEHLHADVVQVADDRNAQARMEAGKTFLKLGQYAAAKSAFEEASRLTPQNYLCWWGQIQADITAGELINRNDYRYQNALKTAPAETVPQLEKAFQAHIEAYNKRAREAREQQEADNLAEWDRCRATARELISRLDAMIDVLSRKAEDYKKKHSYYKARITKGDSSLSKMLSFLSVICFLAAAPLAFWELGVFLTAMLGTDDFVSNFSMLYGTQILLGGIGAVALGLFMKAVAKTNAKNHKSEQQSISGKATRYWQKCSSAALYQNELSQVRSRLNASLQMPYSPQNSTDLKNNISAANMSIARTKQLFLDKEESDKETD